MARFLSQYGYLLAYFLFLFFFMLKTTRLLPEKLAVKLLLLAYIALFTFQDISVGFDYKTTTSLFRMENRLSVCFATATAFFSYSFIYLYIAENHVERDGFISYLLMGG